MKTLYVPKGKTLHYERLECQTIIADGTLVVDGAVRAKHITGKGLLDAGSVYSPTVSVRDLNTVKVVCDLLAAEYARAVEVIVSSSAVVSRYADATAARTAPPPGRKCSTGPVWAIRMFTPPTASPFRPLAAKHDLLEAQQRGQI